MPTRQADYTRRLDLLTSACYSCSPSRPLSLWKNKRETTTKSKTEEKEEKKRVYAGKREHLVTFNSPIVTSKSYIWRSCPPLLNWGIQEQTRLTGVNKIVTADLLLTWSVMSHLFNSVLGKIWIYLFKKRSTDRWWFTSSRATETISYLSATELLIGCNLAATYVQESAAPRLDVFKNEEMTEGQ